MTCPSSESLATFASGVDTPARPAIEQHLDGCASCRRAVAEAAHLAGDEVAPGDKERGALLRAGDRVDRYEVLELVGAGGMGVIYSAFDPTLSRTVALKLVRPWRLADGATRLLAEAKVMARVTHPDVMPVYDAGTFGDQVFIAMEWVAGQTLRAWLAQKRRPVGEVLEVFLRAGKGLAAAHAAGIIHRDFKPENVLIGDDGRVRVSDFGLARLHTGESVGGVSAAGTLSYMAPEARTRGAVTPAVDQFAFCVALHEALGPRLPRAIARAVERGRSESPSERFDSMTALLAALSPARRASRWAMGLTVALLAVGGWGLWRHQTRCAGSDEKLAKVWNPARKQALLATAGAERSVLTLVASLLDSFGERWAEQRQQACLETRERGAQSEALLDLEMSCFQQRLVGVEALLGALEKPGTHPNALAATHEAIALSRCTDAAYLTAANGGVVEPEARERAAGAREAMTRVRQALALVVSAEVVAASETLVGNARALGLKSVEAEARLLHAQAMHQVMKAAAEAPAVEAELDEAVLAATEAKYPQLVAEATAERLRMTLQGGDFGAAAKQERVLAAQVRGLGVDPLMQARHDALRASLLTRTGKPAEAIVALAHGRQMAALLPELESRVLRASLAAQQGLAEATAGDMKAAYATLLAAVTLTEAAWGSTDRRLGELHHNLGEVVLHLGRVSECVPHYEQATAVWTVAYGAANPRVAVNESAKALCLAQLGRFDDARRAIDRARVTFTEAHLERALFALRLGCASGEVERRRGDLKQSVSAFEGAFEVPAKGQFPFAEASCRVEFARALMATGDHARAVEVARRAFDELAALPPTDARRIAVDVVNAELGVSTEPLAAQLAALERQGVEPALRARIRLSLPGAIPPSALGDFEPLSAGEPALWAELQRRANEQRFPPDRVHGVERGQE